ncbi:copper amine oxidase N-terminal domain-containing protein [Paenibacillus glycinis]|uniref:Copper amine oxidase-like N-terminal domain-containing protein n=1 Tax=Paenibacillus glycinis TaxID=2697035 RepID=A0ABW9XNG9_9BACL|nr:copper amine oxidase N-terminal domain-containing protein [Paenibacillus glycinis]NBD24184.1 hypothetical protein [Paenibacillus glycinis]
MKHQATKALYRVLLLGLAGMLTLFASLPAAEAAPAPNSRTANAPIAVVLDRQPLKLASPPVLIAGKLMFPAKAFFDAAGVSFQAKNGQITAVRGSVQVQGKVGSAKAVKGKQTFVLPAPPIVQAGRTYVPAKFVALVLDKDVVYAAGAKTVTIGYSERQVLGFQKLLFEAARSGDAATVELMIGRGAEANKKLPTIFLDNTALDYALLFNRTEAARVLLEHGGTYAANRVFQVVLNGNAELMELLLAHGLDPDTTLGPPQEDKLLTTACGTIWSINPDNTETVIEPSAQIVKLLLDYGADPSMDDSLSRAVQAHSYEVIQLLLQHGADPYRPDSYGASAYERAQSEGIRSWLTLGANPAIPHLSIADAAGRPVLDGRLTIESGSSAYGRTDVHWSGSAAYFDVPDGDYGLTAVGRWGASYVLPDTELRVCERKADPGLLRLPALNVNAVIAKADGENGMLSINDRNGNLLTFVEVDGGKFGLFLPPGTYEVGRYVSPGGDVALTGDTSITIPENGGVQQLKLSKP